ncbi:unnamed protein product [Prorocentrum cordatum]|uniref:Uncharacterized protein n=1 Tax=Prorocentrum cordatum TaxID=2364126 RepID=A0ABN9UAX7_9DINO|nr:unnamed protein product [Polarella glacialis]
MLGRNSVLQELHLDRNRVADEGAEALAAALESNTGLAEMWLVDNRFGTRAAQRLGLALLRNDALKRLGLSQRRRGRQRDRQTMGLMEGAMRRRTRQMHAGLRAVVTPAAPSREGAQLSGGVTPTASCPRQAELTSKTDDLSQPRAGDSRPATPPATPTSPRGSVIGGEHDDADGRPLPDGASASAAEPSWGGGVSGSAAAAVAAQRTLSITQLCHQLMDGEHLMLPEGQERSSIWMSTPIMNFRISRPGSRACTPAASRAASLSPAASKTPTRAPSLSPRTPRTAPSLFPQSAGGPPSGRSLVPGLRWRGSRTPQSPVGAMSPWAAAEADAAASAATPRAAVQLDAEQTCNQAMAIPHLAILEAQQRPCILTSMFIPHLRTSRLRSRSASSSTLRSCTPPPSAREVPKSPRASLSPRTPSAGQWHSAPARRSPRGFQSWKRCSTSEAPREDGDAHGRMAPTDRVPCDGVSNVIPTDAAPRNADPMVCHPSPASQWSFADLFRIPAPWGSLGKPSSARGRSAAPTASPRARQAGAGGPPGASCEPARSSSRASSEEAPSLGDTVSPRRKFEALRDQVLRTGVPLKLTVVSAIGVSANMAMCKFWVRGKNPDAKYQTDVLQSHGTELVFNFRQLVPGAEEAISSILC